MRAVLILPLALLASPAFAASNLGWVGLYDPEHVSWLENVNRLEELCPKKKGAADYEAECKKKVTASKRLELLLYAKPDEKSDVVGKLWIDAVPGRGFRGFYFEGASSRSAVDFEPDLFDGDWGYGPYYHHTALEKAEGKWFLLPAEPLKAPAWVHLDKLSSVDLKSIEVGTVYEFEVDRSVVPIKVGADVVLMRDEQPSDMWCEEGEPPPAVGGKVNRVAVKDLYDENKHLKLRVKYMRGC